ncbi:hypothetical protein EES43_16600 [Streptomyces sp. ADI96-02]|uniref:ABC transporter substrate-binding protein n=1 Tax=unclassified Streptomyces TaxID=2593676 RepID=UPI000F552B19|nr:ABC transporter substrate-binding protein [Streptomyces sp. ADI96-02]RPK60871.1 hypothetical protein EES43_16600 [Streptomyces sp. ADI96-02]
MTGRRRPTFSRSFQCAVGAAAAGATALSGCGVLPGDPGGSGGSVTVMTWAPDRVEDADAVSMPGVPAMARTYARWINEQGGIGGRELKVVVCDEDDTAAGAERCAREAVDRKVAAVVGSYSRYGQSFIPALEAGGVPYIGGYGASAEEFESYLSFPVNGGQPALLAGHGRQLASSCERVSLVRPDSIVGAGMPQLLDTGLLAAHRPASTDILAAEDATSYDGQAAKALGRTGGSCVTAVLGARTETFVDSLRRLGPDGERARISSVLGSVSQRLIDRTGGRDSPFEGAYVTGWYPDAGDPRWDEMRRVIGKYAFKDNRVDPDDTGVQTTWIAYTALREVVEAIGGEGAITAGRIVNALNRGAEVDTGGLTPVLRWRFKDMIGTFAYPRIVNAKVTFQVVREGRLTAQREGFVDVTDALADVPRTAAG